MCYVPGIVLMKSSRLSQLKNMYAFNFEISCTVRLKGMKLFRVNIEYLYL
jgi:hypothetical protein